MFNKTQVEQEREKQNSSNSYLFENKKCFCCLSSLNHQGIKLLKPAQNKKNRPHSNY